MTKGDLLAKKCVPCEGGTPPLLVEQVERLLAELGGTWQVAEGRKITRKFKFRTFGEAMDFVNRAATLAEGEGHHPDMTIRYNLVLIELTTHVIHGLSENDFILAAKIDEQFSKLAV